MTDGTQRLLINEQLVNDLRRQVKDMLARLALLEQTPWANPGGGFGGGGAGAFAFVPGSAMPAASAPAPAGTASSLAAQSIYQFASGTWTTLSATATVYNGTLSPIVAGQLCWLQPDGAGDYVILTQVCN